MSAPLKVIRDLDIIPTAFAVTRNGRAETLIQSEYQILILLQRGPATAEEVLKASGLQNMNSVRKAVHSLRRKLKPLGVMIPNAQRLGGNYALARARS